MIATAETAAPTMGMGLKPRRGVEFTTEEVRRFQRGEMRSFVAVAHEIDAWRQRDEGFAPRNWELQRSGWWAEEGGAPLGPFQNPYGWPGDLLYVQEPWRTLWAYNDLAPGDIERICRDVGYHQPWCPVLYEADGKCRDWKDRHLDAVKPGRLRQAGHMRVWASRYIIMVERTRVLRLHDLQPESPAINRWMFSVDFRLWSNYV